MRVSDELVHHGSLEAMLDPSGLALAPVWTERDISVRRRVLGLTAQLVRRGQLTEPCALPFPLRDGRVPDFFLKLVAARRFRQRAGELLESGIPELLGGGNAPEVAPGVPHAPSRHDVAAAAALMDVVALSRPLEAALRGFGAPGRPDASRLFDLRYRARRWLRHPSLAAAAPVATSEIRSGQAVATPAEDSDALEHFNALQGDIEGIGRQLGEEGAVPLMLIPPDALYGLLVALELGLRGAGEGARLTQVEGQAALQLGEDGPRIELGPESEDDELFDDDLEPPAFVLHAGERSVPVVIEYGIFNDFSEARRKLAGCFYAMMDSSPDRGLIVYSNAHKKVSEAFSEVARDRRGKEIRALRLAPEDPLDPELAREVIAWASAS